MKKYYVSNKKGQNSIVSFIKKNNKILLDFNNLNYIALTFFLDDNIFQDLLRNLEIIRVSKEIYLNKKNILAN